MACCNASGTRALYDLWHGAVTRHPDEVAVNLLFSRATPEVVVKSQLPFVGQIEIITHTDRALRMRIPAYVSSASLQVAKNGQNQPVERAGPWLRLPRSKRGDVFVVRFDLPERTDRFHLGYQSYEVHYRGDTVTAIVPEGRVSPLYQRRWAAGPPPPVKDPVLPSVPEIDSL
jgi:hypothetical protein